MKGEHRVELDTKRLRYQFLVRRNITIIQGDSATGKTTLIDLLDEYARFSEATGIRLQSDVPCIVLRAGPQTWKAELGQICDSIVFVDEGSGFVFSKDFAECIRDSSNYYVIVARRPLKQLPYSIHEVYGIRTVGKYHFPEKIYHEFYPLYGVMPALSADNESLERILILEDAKAGFQFFAANESGYTCLSANGNTGIYDLAARIATTGKAISVIADGAAFGAYIEEMVLFAGSYPSTVMYFPECFEWMILRSGAVAIADMGSILSNPSDYIESRVFFSWERFFYDVLRKGTADSPRARYNKDCLPQYYYEGRNRQMILSVIPEEIKRYIEP